MSPVTRFLLTGSIVSAGACGMLYAIGALPLPSVAGPPPQ